MNSVSHFRCILPSQNNYDALSTSQNSKTATPFLTSSIGLLPFLRLREFGQLQARLMGYWAVEVAAVDEADSVASSGGEVSLAGVVVA
jgi:hypothetical protein